MLKQKSDRPSHNLNLLLFQGMLNVVGSCVALVIWAHPGSTLLYVTSGLTVGAGLVSIALAFFGRKLGDWTASLILLGNVVPVSAMLWVTGELEASRGRFWVPFDPHNLSSLAIAILAPPVRVIGVIAIGIFPLLATIQMHFFSPQALALTPPDPLMAPIAFGLFAFVLYFFRLRALKIAKLVAEREAEVEMMKKFTRSIFAVKDLANSPIQALLLDAELLGIKHPDAKGIADRISQSVAKLKELNRVLDSHIANETQAASNLASLDSAGELRAVTEKP